MDEFADRSQDSSVIIVTRLLTAPSRDRGSVAGRGKIFLFNKASILILTLSPGTCISVIYLYLVLSLKKCVEVYLHSTYAFMVWRLIKQKEFFGKEHPVLL